MIRIWDSNSYTLTFLSIDWKIEKKLQDILTTVLILLFMVVFKCTNSKYCVLYTALYIYISLHTPSYDTSKKLLIFYLLSLFPSNLSLK